MELARADASKPLLTYYDASGTRTELSGATVANWQSKIANLFADFYDVRPGSRVSLSLPNHWVVPAIVGAVAWLGADLELTNSPDAQTTLAVVGPDDLLALPNCEIVVACSLDPLALPFLDPVPVGVDDFFAEVRTQADVFARTRSPRVVPIIHTAGGALDLSDSTALDATVGSPTAAQRILIVVSPQAQSRTPIGLPELAATCALPAIREASVVVVAQTPDTDLDAIALQERVEATIVIGDE